MDPQQPPLTGIKVLDLSRVLAGPWATQLMADLGAEVIKVERPGVGDDTRAWGPPWFTGPDGAREAAYFACANRGKRSVALDLATAEGAAQVKSLALEADVVVENFKPGALARHGLDADSLMQLNPRLIYCTVSGFGAEGPYADRPGYDFIIQAMGGLMSVTGAADAGPTKAGVALVDIMSGLYACNGVLAALQRRQRTGVGGLVEVALFDVQVATLANQASNYLASGRDPKRWGNAHPNIVPYQDFPCADGYLAVAVGNDRQFRALCEVLELPAIGADPAYATNADRVAHREALIPLLAQAFTAQPGAWWVERLNAAGVPAGVVNTLSSLFADPHLEARGLKLSMAHDTLGEIPGVACPIRIDRRPQQAETGVPSLGSSPEARFQSE